MIELVERDRLNQFIGQINSEVEYLSVVPNTHRKATLLDQLSSLRNDINMILKRCDDGMSVEDAAKPCKFFQKIVIDNN